MLTLLCLIGGGVKWQILGKNTQVHLIIIRKWPKNTPSPHFIKNLDNFPPGAFHRHQRVYDVINGYQIQKLCIFLSRRNSKKFM